MSNPLVLQVIGVLLVLFFIFLLVMCWKSWRITHILFLFFVFAGAATFLVFAAMVLKTQGAWRSQYNTVGDDLTKEIAEQELLLHGDLVEVQQGEECIRSLRSKLDDEWVDRGRVWRGCTLIGTVDANTLRVRTVPANLPQGETPQSNGIAPQTDLYIFTERVLEDGMPVPEYYLGKFVVQDANEAEVTLSAVLPLGPDQVQRIQQGGSTWALYDVMPLDSHEALAQWDETEKRMVGMDKQELAPYFPNLFNWPQDKYDKFLDRYARFNREATDTDPPEETWVLVKFVKPHTIQVDSDAEQSLLEGEGSYFDSSGRAIEGRLRRGEEGTVRFEVDETGIFDLDTADTLIADGVCEKVKALYRRPLLDFEHFFDSAYHRHQVLDLSIARAQRDTTEMVALKTKAEEQLAYRSDEKVKLEQDYAGFQRELADVTRHADALEQAWIEKRVKLSALYQENRRLADELTKLQSQLAQEINRRALESAASGSP